MSENETITVADVSAGVGGDGTVEPGTSVVLPAVELLTGRGFVTGKSGSGKSNTASVIIENLLSNNFPVLIVDTDGEYYGLKEAFEILHAGADDECDIQVSPEHAEKIATLALEQNVPIILDVSGYLDESVAKELLLETTRHLFAKEKKLKKPFLMLVEECHEYIPEGGGLDETGKMLIKVGKRGRKHGLGIVGISQRPADVKKDFITQCDWLVWHRLTWRNDTKVVGRILGKEYAEAIEEMGDGEGFLVTDWSESIRRVQFHRKETFDAGATPGLEDFERPELKSVSDDLVGDLRNISDEQERRESRLADLRQELDKKDRKIADLERELEQARDLKRMADRFSQALLSRAEAPYRGGNGRNFNRPADKQAALREYDGEEDRPRHARNGEAGTVAAPNGTESDDSNDSAPDEFGDADALGAVFDYGPMAGDDRQEATNGSKLPFDDPDSIEANAGTDSLASYPEFAAVAGRIEGSLDRDTTVLDLGDDADHELVALRLSLLVNQLDPVSRAMLAHYREVGTASPVDAHAAAGAGRDERLAYTRNRPLRVAGFVAHVGCGRYEYAVDDLVMEEFGDQLSTVEVDATVAAVERAFSPETGDRGAGATADD